MLRRRRRIAAVSLGSALILIASAAQAIPPPSLRRVDEDHLIAMTDTGGVETRTDIRLDDTVQRPAAWRAFTAGVGARWSATWDHATGVPSRLWGPGIAVPGASADPDVAARLAFAVIVAHLDLLAPGATAADLTLVTDRLDGDLRTVGWIQTHAGLPVIGGQISVRIEHDRIFVISSQALPDVAVELPRAKPLAAPELADRARAGLDRALALPPDAIVGAPADAAILPLVGDDGVIGYRVVRAVDVDVGSQGDWTAYTDPATGEVVARHQRLMYDVSGGDVDYDAVVRWRGRPRAPYPAGSAALVVNGVATTATGTGGIVWTTGAPASVTTSPVGADVTLFNDTGDIATGSITVPPGGTGVWSAADDELVDAQVNGFIHARVVREFAKTHFAIDLPFLYEPVQVHVNIDDQCNAYSNGTAIHFYKSSPAGAQNHCENTARIADVVYHEFGHSIHEHAIIEGVGAFNGGMSEGAGDFLAASITEDSGMGRGFFGNDEALRELDPPGDEATYPEDVGEVHTTGLIFGGTFWDLRKRLIADLGPDAGKALVLKLYYASLQRATDIPSCLIEALAADDDDGDLTNGTPHECAIRDTFGHHGMRTVSGEVVAPGAVVATVGQTAAPVEVRINGVASSCTGDEISGVFVGWRPGVGGTPAAGGIEATQTGSTYVADVPLPGDGGRVDFQAEIAFADGTNVILPDNPADQYYQMYQGTTVPLYCTDFESDPFAAGWQVTRRSGITDFEWGVANNEHSATDPPAAYSGEHVLGLGIGYDYGDQTSTEVVLPPIDVSAPAGLYSDVLIQYRRWLAVEDGFFDHAVIAANGAAVWTNFDSMMGNNSTTAHIDREWRFQSIPLSTRFSGSTLNLSFRLDSDEGLHFGGWSIDDLCVVANPESICGDGVRANTEECDTGAANADAADTCRTYCKLPTCGDGILDTGEECDPGVDDHCLPACLLDDGGGGCCSTGTGTDPTGLLLAGPVAVLLLGRRRRRRVGRGR